MYDVDVCMNVYDCGYDRIYVDVCECVCMHAPMCVCVCMRVFSDLSFVLSFQESFCE